MINITKEGKIEKILKLGEEEAKDENFIRVRLKWKKFREEMINMLKNPKKDDLKGKKITKIDQVSKFINKLKSPENYNESLVETLQKYNLGRFRDDVSRAIIEAILQGVDVGLCLEVSKPHLSNIKQVVITLQAKYQDEFEESFTSCMHHVLKDENKKFKNDKNKNTEKSDINGMTNFVRIFFELALIGVDLNLNKLIKYFLNLVFYYKNDQEFVSNLPMVNMFIEFVVEDLLKIKSSKIKNILKPLKKQKKAGVEQNKNFDLLEYKFNKEDYLTPDQTKLLVTKLTEFATKLYKIYGNLYKIKKKESEFIHAIMMETGNLHQENAKKFKEITERFNRLEETFFIMKTFMNLKYEPYGKDDLKSAYKPDPDNKEMREYSLKELEEVFENEEDYKLYAKLLDSSTITSQKSDFDGSDVNPETQKNIKNIIESFSSCTNSATADVLVLKFLEHSNKYTRKSLVEFMADFKKDYHLVIPYFARVLAHIAMASKDIKGYLIEKLKFDYKLFKKRDKTIKNSLLDNRIRNISFTAECTKFRVLNPQYLIKCMKESLIEYSNNDCKVIVAALQSCGRFMYLFEESSEDFGAFLEELKIKNEQDGPPKYKKRIEIAVTYCENGSSLRDKREDNLPEHVRYFKFLIDSLNFKNFDEMLMEIKTLPWSTESEDLINYFCLILTRQKPSKLYYLTFIIGHLRNFYPNLVYFLIDLISDYIIESIEATHNSSRDKQAVINLAIFISEMVNSKIFNMDDLFRMLNFLIKYNEKKFCFSQLSDEDKEDNFSLVVALKIVNHLNRKMFFGDERMKDYIICLQLYTLSKSYIPTSLEMDILKAIRLMYPRLKIIKAEEIPDVTSAMKNSDQQLWLKYKKRNLEIYQGRRGKKKIRIKKIERQRLARKKKLARKRIQEEVEKQMIEAQELQRLENLKQMKAEFESEFNHIVHEQADKAIGGGSNYKVSLQDLAKTNFKDIRRKTEKIEGCKIISRNRDKIEISKLSDASFQETLKKAREEQLRKKKEKFEKIKRRIQKEKELALGKDEDEEEDDGEEEEFDDDFDDDYSEEEGYSDEDYSEEKDNDEFDRGYDHIHMKDDGE